MDRYIAIQTLEDLKIAVERMFSTRAAAEIRATLIKWHAVPAGIRLASRGEWISIEPNLLDTWDIDFHKNDSAALYESRREPGGRRAWRTICSHQAPRCVATG